MSNCAAKHWSENYARKPTGAGRTTFSPLLFFLTLSSPSVLRLSRFPTPFSSVAPASPPGTGPQSASCFSRFGLGFVNVYPPPISRLVSLPLSLGFRKAYDSVFELIFRLLEVQIMANMMITAAVDAMEDDFHIELAPALLLDQERCLLHSWSRLASTPPSESDGRGEDVLRFGFWKVGWSL
jgi:hypothetical protein